MLALSSFPRSLPVRVAMCFKKKQQIFCVTKSCVSTGAYACSNFPLLTTGEIGSTALKETCFNKIQSKVPSIKFFILFFFSLLRAHLPPPSFFLQLQYKNNMATNIKLKRSNKKISVSDNLENAPQRYYKILAKI